MGRLQRWACIQLTIILLGGAVLLAQQQNLIASGQEPSPPQPRDGNTLFHQSGCSYCHGDEARGTVKAPSLQGIGQRWKRDRIERQIREGGGGMPAFGEALEANEITRLASYLESMKGKPSFTTAPRKTSHP